jgi:acetoin utilization deacetylase AcuC-like enzyme
VVILNCDMHQGDGTASILTGDPTVFSRRISRVFRSRNVFLNVNLTAIVARTEESW